MTPDDPGYAAWVAGRKDYIGASEVAAVLGISPWDSPHDVWGVKLGHWEPKQSTLAMELGHWMEEFIARRWVGRDGERIVKAAGTIELPGRSHLRASPDRDIVGVFPGGSHGSQSDAYEECVGHVECKNVGWRLSHHWSDGPPIYVQAQCQFQLAATGESRVDVVAMVDDEIRQYTIERDQATIDRIVEQVDAWWQRHIVGGVRPPVDSGPSEKVAAALSRMHVPECVSPVFVPYDIEEAVFDLGRKKALAKDLDADITALENVIKDAIGDTHTDAMRPDSDKPIATWRPQESRRVNTTRLRDEYPDVADAVTETTTSNVFRAYPARCN